MLKIFSKFYHQNSLSAQLLKVVFGLYLIVAVTITLLHMLFEYRDAKQKIIQDLQLFHHTFVPTLADDIWNMNYDELDSSVSGLLSIPVIVGIEIRNQNQEILISRGLVFLPDESLAQVTEDGHFHAVDDQLIELFGETAPVKYSKWKNATIAFMTLYSSNQVVLDAVRAGFIYILINAFIKTAALWLIFLGVGYFLLNRPLVRFIEATHKINTDQLEHLTIDLDIPRQNELKDLEMSFNKMISRLHLAIKASEQTQQEIYNLQESAVQELEIKVQERTSELKVHQKELRQALRETQERGEEINITNALISAINATLNIRDMLKNLMDIAFKRHFPWEGAAVHFLCADECCLELADTFAYATEYIDQLNLLKTVSIPLHTEDNLWNQVLQSGSPFYTQQMELKSLTTDTDRIFFKQFPAISVSLLPLINQRKTFGVILFFTIDYDLCFKKTQIQEMEKTIGQVVNAFHNVRLYQQVQNTQIQLAETEKIAQMTLTFEKFVPKPFLKRIAQEGIENIKLGYGESESITILFSDIRRFTELSESMTPQEVLNFLNSYFKRMNEPINQHHGIIDKFIGDAIMVIFENTESLHEMGAQEAIYAAIAMQEALVLYNNHRSNCGYRPISIGIGIHSGPVVIGTVGALDRMDSTVIGDSVNLAARLESATKVYNAKILISHDTLCLLKSISQFCVRELDWLRVKGRREPVSVYEIFDNDSPEIKQLKTETSPYITHSLYLRKMKQWDEAIYLLHQALAIYPEDEILRFHIQYCEGLKVNPPPEEWDGASDVG